MKAEQEVQAGNWPRAKASFLSVYGNAQLSAMRTVRSRLGSAPKSVRAADASIINTIVKIRKALQMAKSSKQFVAFLIPIEAHSPVASDERILGNYVSKVCGSSHS